MTNGVGSHSAFTQTAPDSGFQYPLELQFKIFSLGAKVTVCDAADQELFYVDQKAFKLKEDVAIRSLTSQDDRSTYHLKADRALDFGASYQITDDQGEVLGTLKRHGKRSLWRVHYELDLASNSTTHDAMRSATVQETNPSVKLVDGLINMIPIPVIPELVTNWVLHPAYQLSNANGEPIMRFQKRTALFERKFTIEKVGTHQDDSEIPQLLGLMMIAILEQDRG